MTFDLHFNNAFFRDIDRFTTPDTMNNGGNLIMQNEIHEIIKQCCIELVGIADLSPALTQLVGQGGTIFKRYPRAVSLGCSLANEVVDSIEDHGNRALVMNYIHHIYSVVNQRLDQAALSVTGFLMERRLSLLGKHVFGGNYGLCVQSCHFGKPKGRDEDIDYGTLIDEL